MERLTTRILLMKLMVDIQSLPVNTGRVGASIMDELKKPGGGDRVKVERWRQALTACEEKERELVDYWIPLLKEVKELKSEELESLNKELQTEKARATELSRQVASLQVENEKLKARSEELRGILNNQLFALVADIQATIETRAAQMKFKREGGKIAKKSKIDDEELKRAYASQGYKITPELLAYFNQKDSITYDGMRKRLVTLGVWRGRDWRPKEG